MYWFSVIVGDVDGRLVSMGGLSFDRRRMRFLICVARMIGFSPEQNESADAILRNFMLIVRNTSWHTAGTTKW